MARVLMVHYSLLCSFKLGLVYLRLPHHVTHCADVARSSSKHFWIKILIFLNLHTLYV